NSSDRIITDITFRPSIGSKVLPTTTALVLEFIHPQTLKLGLAPGETMTNNGHDPERFQFFIGNLSQEVLQQIRSDLSGSFAIEVLDLHFSSEKGYKGHIRVMDVEEAFEAQLKPIRNTLMKTETELASRRNALALAQEAFSSDRRKVMAEYTSAVEKLKRSSLRYKSAVDSKKGRSIFEDINVGTYLLYATNETGEAIFEEINVHEGKNQLMIHALRKDPFLP
ncbi:MAG: hypothetical protein RRA35_07925, partial [Desulfomonilia bacterium]|nr:hypothetical protein [Desulfomonilia bacterium]